MWCMEKEREWEIVGTYPPHRNNPSPVVLTLQITAKAGRRTDGIFTSRGWGSYKFEQNDEHQALKNVLGEIEKGRSDRSERRKMHVYQHDLFSVNYACFWRVSSQ
jgi:hypothetical protein